MVSLALHISVAQPQDVPAEYPVIWAPDEG